MRRVTPSERAAAVTDSMIYTKFVPEKTLARMLRVSRHDRQHAHGFSSRIGEKVS